MVHCQLAPFNGPVTIIAYTFLDLSVPPVGASQGAGLFFFVPYLFFTDNLSFKVHDINTYAGYLILFYPESRFQVSLIIGATGLKRMNYSLLFFVEIG